MKKLILLFQDQILQESSRWFLWWPVGMGIGIGGYFSLCFEPSVYWNLLTPFLMISTFFLRHRIPQILYGLCALLCSICLGFSAISLKVTFSPITMIETPVKNVRILGKVNAFEEKEDRYRITLDDVYLNASQKNNNVRLNVKKEIYQRPQVGEKIEGLADLLPFSEPVSLYAHDFRRQAFFEGLGSTGRLKVILKKDMAETSTLNEKLQQFRKHLSITIQEKLRFFPIQVSYIAQALVVGERWGIDPTIRQDFSDSGLAHILAISGLHMSLLAACAFLLLRRGLATIPYITERFPTKKWASVGVIFITFCYLLISGLGIPAIRSWIMITLAMIAILIDRHPFTLRLVAIAATVILLIQPESLLSASFQLSFAAVIGLVAAYEKGGPQIQKWILKDPPSFWGARFLRNILIYAFGTLSSSFIATLATAPLIMVIFHRVSLVSIFSNVLAVPLTAMWLMPGLFLSVLLCPFQMADPLWTFVGYGIEVLTKIANLSAHLPLAVITAPSRLSFFLPLFVLSCCWFVIWQGKMRWLGLLALPLIWGTSSISYFPKIFMAGDGSVIAIRNKDSLYVSNTRRNGFYTDIWQKEMGLKDLKIFPSDNVETTLGNDVVRIITKKDFAFKKWETFARTKGILLVKGFCPQFVKNLCLVEDGCYVFDKKTLEKSGTLLFFEHENQWTQVSLKSIQAHRPWSRNTP